MKIEITPDLDPHKLSQEDKIKLVRQTDGLLIEILKNEKIEGDLDLNKCISLVSLPKGLKIGGRLSLYKCFSLTHLPEGLKVGGSLYLDRCTGLYHLKEKKIKGVKGKIVWE